MENEMKEERKRVVCPYCGYRMPIYIGKGAHSEKIYVKCKGRNCKKEFEIRAKEK